MCKAIYDMIEDGRNEGREQGESRINALIQKLFEDNRAEEVQRMAADRKYQKQLLKEYGL